MSLAADRLIDWKVAARIGARVSGQGLALPAVERARLREDFSEVVAEAEAMVSRFTGLSPGGPPARAWVMSRPEWVERNLMAFERILEPFAQKVVEQQPAEGAAASVRRYALGAQLGGLLGYLGRRVLGQYDLFLPPDDDGLLYFVGTNVVSVERRFGFPQRDFRLWIALHEVAHRVQFGGVPWLRGHVSGLVDSYLSSVELDPKQLLESLKRAVEELRSGRAEWRGFGWIFLLMTPEQRDMFRRMQAVMSLLEGHGNFVMDAVGRTRVSGWQTFRSRLRERRHRRGVEKAFQRAIGFDTKVRQYDMGERFVAQVVDRVGMEGFNRVWEAPSTLPTLEEVGRPEAWVARVGAP